MCPAAVTVTRQWTQVVYECQMGSDHTGPHSYMDADVVVTWNQ